MSLTLEEEYGFKLYENRVLSRTFRRKRDRLSNRTEKTT